jgi:hypothetical protein
VVDDWGGKVVARNAAVGTDGFGRQIEMVTRVLFGVQNSPHRKVCVALAWIVALLGIGVGVMQGWPLGVPVVLVGLVAVAVLARRTASHHERVETRTQLSRSTVDRDAEALRQMVEHAPHDPNDQLATVSGYLDSSDLSFSVAEVRS